MFRRLAVGAALALVSGCAAQFDGDEEGQAVAQITNVPSQIACIRINIKGATRNVERKFSVSAGQSATLTMSGLPTGEVTFTGDAFPQLCSSVSSSTAPSWSSDPTTVVLWAGSMSTVSLKFQRTSNVTVTVDFVEDAGGGPFDLAGSRDGGALDFAGSSPDGGSVTWDLAGSPYDGGSPAWDFAWAPYDGGTPSPGDLAWAPRPDLN
jgi:hypothetical protein